jgi:hypothetical protein
MSANSYFFACSMSTFSISLSLEKLNVMLLLNQCSSDNFTYTSFNNDNLEHELNCFASIPHNEVKNYGAIQLNIFVK